MKAVGEEDGMRTLHSNWQEVIFCLEEEFQPGCLPGGTRRVPLHTNTHTKLLYETVMIQSSNVPCPQLSSCGSLLVDMIQQPLVQQNFHFDWPQQLLSWQHVHRSPSLTCPHVRSLHGQQVETKHLLVVEASRILHRNFELGT